MVKFAKVFAVALALVAVIATAQARPDKDEKTLKGTVTCAKCDLGVESKCATVIKVKGDDGKDVVYYFDQKGDKANHGKICKSPKEGSVTGTVSSADIGNFLAENPFMNLGTLFDATLASIFADTPLTFTSTLPLDWTNLVAESLQNLFTA